MITKCVICKTETKDGNCPRCNAGSKKETSVKNNPDCQVCGGKGGRAREIKRPTSKNMQPGWYCYDCCQELQLKGFHCCNKTYPTKAEANYYRALTDHYLKPLFYNEEPNHEIIEQKRFAVMYAMKKDDIM